MNEEERYADAIGAIGLTGPVVRMDLVSLSATEKDDKNEPKPVVRQRIVMPLEGFVRSFALMAQVMQQLEKQGVIKRPGAGGEAKVVPEVAPPKSANFK
jgi:hypothetical protein